MMNEDLTLYAGIIRNGVGYQSNWLVWAESESEATRLCKRTARSKRVWREGYDMYELAVDEWRSSGRRSDKPQDDDYMFYLEEVFELDDDFRPPSWVGTEPAWYNDGKFSQLDW